MSGGLVERWDVIPTIDGNVLGPECTATIRSASNME